MPTTSPCRTVLSTALEARRVLRMTLASPDQSAVELENHVSSFMQYARQMKLDLSRQWLLVCDGRTISACTCIESPGRTAMLFLPDSSLHPTTITQTLELVRPILEDETARDIRLAQSLLNPEDVALRAALSTAGFSEIAELLYMECFADDAVRRDEKTRRPPDSDNAWITYSPEKHDLFAALILDTYRDSLDCPGLGGLREIEDIIAGHKSAGLFQPHRWLAINHNGALAGCILLGESPLRSALEVVYMGVHPDARGQGIGKRLVSKCVHLAQSEGFERVTLAVDARNTPAVSIYHQFGFETCNRRTAMICPLGASFRK